jgi:hypothetical protein
VNCVKRGGGKPSIPAIHHMVRRIPLRCTGSWWCLPASGA